MITWSRVLSGGFRDPLVGGHLLFGVALGIGLALLNSGGRLALGHYGPVTNAGIISSLDARGLADILLTETVRAFLFGMLLTFVLMLLRMLLRREWLAAAAFVLLWASAALGDAHPGSGPLARSHSLRCFLLTVLRFGGLVPMIVCFLWAVRSGASDRGFLRLVREHNRLRFGCVLVLTAYAFRTAVAGRPLFKAGFLEPD